MSNIVRRLRGWEGLRWSRNMVGVGEPAPGSTLNLQIILNLVYVNKTVYVLVCKRYW